MKTRARASAAAAAVLLSAGLTAAAATATPTAAATPASTATEPGTEAAAEPAAEAATSLRLTVTPGATPAGTSRAAALECPPGSATTHPDPVTACRLVDSVDGDLTRLDVDPGVCTAEYDPYTVTASGTYRGRPLSFRHTYGNRCSLARTTGAVFAF
ncbi:SSI family serine proteinase inhibitor [Kitasatospora sp. NBC_00458]|uniref:SSI family serine proteinase inhibitor n=1 Tax=Kitasatospora sp. NBC_00458 TaxID=2903568 RepID=UPI002E1753A4